MDRAHFRRGQARLRGPRPLTGRRTAMPRGLRLAVADAAPELRVRMDRAHFRRGQARLRGPRPLAVRRTAMPWGLRLATAAAPELWARMDRADFRRGQARLRGPQLLAGSRTAMPRGLRLVIAAAAPELWARMGRADFRRGQARLRGPRPPEGRQTATRRGNGGGEAAEALRPSSRSGWSRRPRSRRPFAERPPCCAVGFCGAEAPAAGMAGPARRGRAAHSRWSVPPNRLLAGCGEASHSFVGPFDRLRANGLGGLASASF